MPLIRDISALEVLAETDNGAAFAHCQETKPTTGKDNFLQINCALCLAICCSVPHKADGKEMKCNPHCPEVLDKFTERAKSCGLVRRRTGIISNRADGRTDLQGSTQPLRRLSIGQQQDQLYPEPPSTTSSVFKSGPSTAGGE